VPESAEYVPSGAADATAADATAADATDPAADKTGSHSEASTFDAAGGAAAGDTGSTPGASVSHRPEGTEPRSSEASLSEGADGTTSGIGVSTGGSDHQSLGISAAKMDELSRLEHFRPPSGGATGSGSEDLHRKTALAADESSRAADFGDSIERPDGIGGLAGPAGSHSDDDPDDIAGIADSIRDIAARLEAGDVHSFGVDDDDDLSFK